MAPMAALEASPVPNAVAVVSVEDAIKSSGRVKLPDGAIRLAVSITVRCTGSAALFVYGLSCGACRSGRALSSFSKKCSSLVEDRVFLQHYGSELNDTSSLMDDVLT